MAAVAAALCVRAGVGKEPPGRAAEAKQAPALFRNIRPGVPYVGSEACKACHQDIYEAFRHTDMGRSMTLPDENAALKALAEPVKVFDQDLNFYFEVSRRGSDSYQSEYRLGSDGKESDRLTERIAYAIGSGQNGFGYIIRRGEYLLEAPLSYYTKSRMWGLSPGYERENRGFSRPVLEECVVCHSGRPRPIKGRDGMFENPPFRELAVGCESCHGPGGLHMEERTAGKPFSEAIDTSIVNPAKLSRWLADNICMNCHQGGDVRVLEPGKDYLDFRPGEPLDSTLAVFKIPLKRPAPPQTVLLEHYFSMTLSECYRASQGELSCLTCHDPHRELKGPQKAEFYRHRCLTCHTEASCAVPLAIRNQSHPPDDCAGCHMPKRAVTRIEHAALTEHRIPARPDEPYPDVAFQATTGGLIHLSAAPDGRNAPVPSLTLLQAYQQLIANGHQEYEPYSTALLKQVAQTHPESPIILAALAQQALADKTARGTAEAIRYLSRALQLGSKAPGNYLLLAELYARSSQGPRAVAALQRGMALFPYRREFYESLAARYVALGQYGDAMHTIKGGLTLFPEDIPLRILLGRVQQAVLPP